METQNNVGVVPEDAPMLSFANSPQPKTNLPISVAELKKQVESQVIDMSTIVDVNALNAQPSFAAATVQGAPSITEMARALAGSATGSTAVGQIFEFVYNNIEWEPGWGVYRGALGCLMDGMGNAFDQSLLLANLLRSAGFTANIVMGEITLSTAQVTNWFGTNDIFSSANYCGNQNIPFTNLAVPFTSLTLGHVWCQVVISGTTYVLDPAFKQYTRTAGLGSATLATALGYNATTFLTNAQSGATIDAGGDFVQNMNRTNVRNDLKTMTANLVSYINANTIGSAAPGTATVEDVIGGQTIIPVTLPLTLVTVLPYEKVGDVPTIWTGDVDNAFKTTLQVEYFDPAAGNAVTINQTFFTDALAATRLTLFFNGSLVPTLYLNGTALQSGNAQTAGTFTSLRLTVNHGAYQAFWGGKTQQSFASGIYAGGSYLIANAWGNLGTGQLEYHQNQAAANIAAGGSLTSEAVLGEKLAIVWYSWAAQNSRATDLLGRITACHFMYNHQVGVIHFNDAGSNAVATDLGLISGAPHNLNNDTTQTPKFQTIVAMHGVALEAIVCAQSNGTPPGVSATSMLDLANRTAVVTVGGTITAGNVATITVNDAALPGGTQAVSYTVLVGDTLTTIATGLAAAVNGNTNLAAIGVKGLGVGATVLVSSTSVNQTTYTVSATGTLTLSVAFEKLYKGSSANWTAGTAIRNNLIANGYTAGDLGRLDTDIPNGYTCVLAERKNQKLGSFTGWAFWEFFPNGFNPAPAGAFGIVNGVYSFGGGQPGTAGNGTQGSNNNGETGEEPISYSTGAYILQTKDLEIGSQEYPYKLSFGRNYDSKSQYANGPLGRGWNHSHNVNATVASNGSFAMGQQYAVPACATIANMFVSVDLAADNARPVSKLMTITIGDNWWVDQMVNNAVVISYPDATNQIYIKQPDGSYTRSANNLPSKLTVVSGLFVLTTPQGVKTNFNSAGQISSVVFPTGVTVSYTYTSGKLTSISNGLGRTLTLNYTGNLLTSVTDGTGRSVSYTVDASSNLTTFQDANGQNTTYAYGTPGLLTQYFMPAFPATAIITNVYDSLSRVKTQANTRNQVTTLYLAGSRAEVVDPVGNKTVRYFSPIGSTARLIDALGFETKTVYDGLNRVVKLNQPEGNYKQMTFDANDNVLSITSVAKSGSGLANIVENMTYDTTWAKLKTYQDGRGNTTTNSYDAATGNLLTIQRPMVGGQTPTVTMTYNGRGQMLTRTDETSIVTQFNYDATTEKLTSMVIDFGVSPHLNLSTSFGYDAVGNVTSLTDARSNQTTFVFNGLRKMTQKTDPGPFSYVTNYGYNASAFLTSTQRQIAGSPAWQSVNWTYSASNKVLTETDSFGRQKSRTYDGKDRLQTLTDGQSRVWQLAYDAVDRLNQITDPNSVVTDFRTFTANGKLASIKDARNNTTQYSWDGFDRANKTIYADATFEQNSSYDANGNVLTFLTRSGNSIVKTFDALNREATRAPQGQPTVTLTYDLANRLTQVSKPVVAGDPSSGATQFFFDTAGRFFKEQYPDAKTVTHVLDGNGNFTKTTWPDAYFIDRVFDQMNRLTDIKLNGSAIVAAHFDYNELSQRTQLTYSNGATVVYNPRLNGDLTGITHNFVGSTMSLAYGFNNVQEPIVASATDSSYIWRPSGASSVPYGATDNVNKYPTVGGVAQTYDGNKNLIGDGTWTYTFDTENHLLTANATGVSASMVYDPMHRQSQKTVGAGKTRYIYSRWQRIADYDGVAGTLQNRYVYGTGIDEPLIQVSNGGVLSFLHADKMGSIVGVSNASGASASKNLYSPFGETSTLSGTNFGFTGQRYDFELGLYYFKMRYFAPKIGRFLQPDPAGFTTEDFNLYSYGNNSPHKYSDPSGTFAVVVGIALAVAAALALSGCSDNGNNAGDSNQGTGDSNQGTGDQNQGQSGGDQNQGTGDQTGGPHYGHNETNPMDSSDPALQGTINGINQTQNGPVGQEQHTPTPVIPNHGQPRVQFDDHGNQVYK
ncbi:MAG: RHS repeat-associated core domain-containing protein [Candidatus Obscuribacterales bacterium]